MCEISPQPGRTTLKKAKSSLSQFFVLLCPEWTRKMFLFQCSALRYAAWIVLETLMVPVVPHWQIKGVCQDELPQFFTCQTFCHNIGSISWVGQCMCVTIFDISVGVTWLSHMDCHSSHMHAYWFRVSHLFQSVFARLCMTIASHLCSSPTCTWILDTFTSGCTWYCAFMSWLPTPCLLYWNVSLGRNIGEEESLFLLSPCYLYCTCPVRLSPFHSLFVGCDSVHKQSNIGNWHNISPTYMQTQGSHHKTLLHLQHPWDILALWPPGKPVGSLEVENQV